MLLRHTRTYRRTHYRNLYVCGYKEENTTTTFFDMLVLNELVRPHLVRNVADRGSRRGSRLAYVKQALCDKLIEHHEVMRCHSQDMPDIRRWRWLAVRTAWSPVRFLAAENGVGARYRMPPTFSSA
ncbi:MAG: hypothetical protein PHI93_04945 [Kiritimatiellae bacterium]|nr:hypothetical protein [Kiritimatiellia bacterium]